MPSFPFATNTFRRAFSIMGSASTARRSVAPVKDALEKIHLTDSNGFPVSESPSIVRNVLGKTCEKPVEITDQNGFPVRYNIIRYEEVHLTDSNGMCSDAPVRVNVNDRTAHHVITDANGFPW